MRNEKLVNFFRKHWFSLFLGCFIALFILFSVVIVVAPHNDAKMRGFTPCTYQMALKLDESVDQSKFQLLKVVNQGYACYFRVMIEGVRRYFNHQQANPWANYLFEAESVANFQDDEDIEPFPEDLLQANLLDDDTESTWEEDNQSKENDNEQK